jgi:hypothetical protein
VGVPAPSGVALGEHQDVLAERRQVAATERTAIRRGLTVLSAPERPPPRWLQLPVNHGCKDCTTPTETGLKPVSSPTVDQRLKRIIAETGRYRVTGLLRLPPDGYRSRLSDYLNAPERTFLPLTEVEISPVDGSAPAEQYSFLALSVQHIVFAVPVDGESD